MTTREKMVDYRKKRGMTIKQMHRKCGVSEHLLENIEEGYVTHPKIAEIIGKAYELTEKEIEDLVPENHRKSSDKYEPDKYVIPEVYTNGSFSLPRTNEIGCYIHEHSEVSRGYL